MDGIFVPEVLNGFILFLKSLCYNGRMKKGKLGFTLIEVAIFLAITGALFVGVSAGVQNSINQQRYNDAVQNFMEFLRTTYSNVSNVQSIIGGGNSEQAIYGRMVTFGEEYDLAGNRIEGTRDRIFSYTVIGDVGNSESGNALQLLDDLKANVVIKGENGFETAGIAESYTPKWAAQIEKPCNGNDCEYAPFTGTLLIVRHPGSGTVYTFYNPTVIEVNKKIHDANQNGAASLDLFRAREHGAEVNYLTNGSFGISQVDFCVNQDPGVATLRGDVRIMKGARNASGVEIIPEERGVCEPK